MAGKYLLKTNDAFDDMVDGATVDLWQAIKPIAQNPSTYSVTEYLYQDYTYDGSTGGNPFPDKEKILQIEFSRSQFIDEGIGAGDTNYAKFFIKSKLYAKMARERTLSYFNKINFQS